MVVFWWTRRGYLALLTTIGVVGLFGALATRILGDEIFDRLPWLWAFAYWAAAASTWVVGSRINGRPVQWSRGEKGVGRFIYDAPNRFVGLPVETWGVLLFALGLLLGLHGLLPRVGAH
jgi:hypothetical protein